MATKEAPLPTVRLTLTDTSGKVRKISMKTGTYLIGRGPGCQIRFPDGTANVSRRHAQIVVEEDGVVRLEDLESLTGTMLNGRIIREKELENDDIISIAGTSMKVTFPQQKIAAETNPSSIVIVARPRDHKPGETDIDQLTKELEDIRKATDRVVSEIGKRIIGQVPIVRSVWATILARGHCLLIGVPGLAKTYLVTTFAETLGLQTKRIQFTPDLMPSDIIGSNVLHETEDHKRYFEFVQGPIFTQLLLADEINRTPPKTQAALLEAMQERQVTVGNKSLSMHEPFCVIATQNPIEQEGTYPLPEAQQDRFMLCLVLDYPSKEEEIEIFLQTTRGTTPDVSEVSNYGDILRYQDTVNRIAVSRELAGYVADLVRATRPDNAEAPDWVKRTVDWGAGPRAGQAILRIARALAAMDGRPAIASADIHAGLLPALRHRINCNFRARSEGLNADKVIQQILEKVAPKWGMRLP